jgi:CubicO group peptidase (beta-lactamase class C family)
MTRQSLLHFAQLQHGPQGSHVVARGVGACMCEGRRARLRIGTGTHSCGPARTFAYARELALTITITLALALICVGMYAGNALAAPTANAPTATTPTLNVDGDFADNIDRHLQALTDRGLFSGAVLVARGDKVVFSKGYGFASVELQVPNSPTTTFRIASVTKQFTAAAVLLLADRKQLSLDDPITKHFPKVPAEWAKVTVRQLLDHTSGIPSYTDFVDLRSFALTSQSPQTIMALSAEKPMGFAPGEKFSYNNTAYVMAGWLIERVSGKSYADFIEQDLLAPIGIKNTGYAFHDKVIAQRAQGYSEDGGKVVNAQFLDMSVPYSAGSMYATTHDLHRWNRQLYGGTLLSKESLTAMIDGGKHRYGLGIGVRKGRYGMEYSHTGGMPGVRTILSYEPESALSIVVLGNLDTAPIEDTAALISEYVRNRAQKLAHHVVLAKPNASPTPESANAISGRYGVVSDKGGEPGLEIQVRVLDGAVYFTPMGGGPLRLHETSPLQFIHLGTMDAFTFKRDNTGKVASIATTFQGKPINLTRLPPADISKQAIFLRGSMNGWGTATKLTASAKSNQFSARIKLTAGAHGFKFATEDWRTIDLGAPSQSRDNVAIGKPVALAPRGTNLRLWADDAGEYEFILDATNSDAATVTVRAVSGN